MDSIFELSVHPVFLAVLVIAVSWLWEDAAVITGALLAVDAKMSVPLALFAVFVGIMTGDLALYYLGRFAHRWRRLRGWILLKPQGRYLSRRFRNNTLTNILYVRFVPGLRTLGFTLCGLWRVPFYRFAYSMAFAGIIWIAIIFIGVYYLGSAEFLEHSHWKWSLMSIALFLLIFNNVWSYYSMKRKVIV